jgi:hypothetical protein
MRHLCSTVLFLILFVSLSITPGSLRAETTAVVTADDAQFVQFSAQEQLFATQCYQFNGGIAGDYLTLILNSSKQAQIAYNIVSGTYPQQCEFENGTFYYPGTRIQLATTGPFTIVVHSTNWFMFGNDIISGSIYVEHKNTQEDININWQAVNRFAQFVDQVFVTRPFKITYQPCQQQNAFTDMETGDIVLCTELINSSISSRLQWAIFLHELGHSLLSGWGERGGKREGDCDDFAAAMLLKADDGVGGIQEFANYLQSTQVPWIDQPKAYEAGDIHPPGTLRASLLYKIIFENPKSFASEWDATLYPHMKAEWLRGAGTRVFESSDRAKTILQQQTSTMLRTPVPQQATVH